MIITDRQNNIIFETSNHFDKWDGSKSGSSLPPDVYLWYLSVRSPSGKSYRKSGTVTIIKNNP
jgi:hypothetical protein